jgi:peptide/nickel transport system substrate-binding protein
MPTTDNGGITASSGKTPFSVTYHINPKAVWSDGTPITSADFAFTWKAELNTTGAYSTAGYDEITNVDASDPATAIVTYKTDYADWWDQFGGCCSFLLEAHAFPNVDPNKPNLKNEMKDSMTFSGGPWIVKSWSQDQLILVPNTKYWGHQPYFDQVTFVPRTDTSTEINSLLTGEVSAIFPQPTNVSLLKQFQANPNVDSVGGGSPYVDMLWLNLQSPPLNDLKVRQALSYAVDRQAVVDNMVKINAPSAVVLNCIGQWIPGTPWCDNTQFAKYTYNPQMSLQILESDGYDCSKVPASPCTKDGQPLSIDYYANAGNTRRADTQQLVKEKALPAGFDLNTKTAGSTPYFGTLWPQGKIPMGDYAGGATDPTVTFEFACKYFPSSANGFSGANWDRLCDPALDPIMTSSDHELNVQKRIDLIHQVGVKTAADIPAIPLYVLPDVSAWRTDKIAGPIGTYNASIYGLWYNMDQWYTVGG